MTTPKWYMITTPKRIITLSTLQALLDQTCEDYVIGEEVGEKTGYEHYQIKICLKADVEYNRANLMAALHGSHWEQARTRDYSYCEKEGKFWRSWEKPLWKYLDMDLRGWQNDVLRMCRNQGERRITVVVDEKGNTGKSYLVRYMQVHHIAEAIPTMENHKDIMRAAMAKKHAKGYIVDVPRAMKPKGAFWGAMEDIKDGHLWDDRYNWKERWIDPPMLLVFTNTVPDKKFLSADRWDIYMVGEGESGGEGGVP